mmetsp:Transcript_6933/g.29256  ORF Transcript_6933/g.29256 Transcript_6933/m.29256 type:complete len:102 (-) Transcript_6933:246-551(-)|eukprot:CAMPEP_0114613432 /NCGR_PEP_ID=MMETSP0168-20121206/5129_1 /TAXON_ID=95228 ORGANISM="Vannella sp., Strain DIVA3 517/6/12" /NCGR_SAMPLE_ID=MMETSP0168 /ASSEMBLY_ACC=CAM_ASM_000044 /LENGTH=101 /DNA_ID=CAMNT_0001824437 /DNA_START=250 /DNA_END=555 /DNA_ORIENTATION=-
MSNYGVEGMKKIEKGLNAVAAAEEHFGSIGLRALGEAYKSGTVLKVDEVALQRIETALAKGTVCKVKLSSSTVVAVVAVCATVAGCVWLCTRQKEERKKTA